MTLGEKQRVFTRLVASLILHAYDEGYELTFGEAYRTKEQAELNAKTGKGIKNSLHVDRLAIDLHLFRRGRYLDRTIDHTDLGAWWELQHPLARWGGRFNDGGHYSLEHDGRK